MYSFLKLDHWSKLVPRMLSPFLPCDALLILVHFDYAWKSLWSKDDFEISQDHRFFWGMFGSFQFSRSPLFGDCWDILFLKRKIDEKKKIKRILVLFLVVWLCCLWEAIWYFVGMWLSCTIIIFNGYSGDQCNI